MTNFYGLGWVEAVGWIASILTVVTYAMNTMMALRILAIVSSFFFIIYSTYLQLWPLLGMELILLPINLYRLWQLLSLRGRLKQAAGSHKEDFSVIRVYGKPRHFKAGSVVFNRGDAVDCLYYIETGRVLVEEVGKELSSSDIFGEIAFFTDAATRTATARCVEDTKLYEVDQKRFMRLQFEDPSFGLSVMRVVTRRLIQNKNQQSAPASE